MLRNFKYVEGLTNLIGTKKFLTNIKGAIKDIDGETVSTENDSEGFKTVIVESWDGVKEYRVCDLIALTFKCYDLPKQLYGEVVAFHIDGDKTNLHAENIGYRFKNGKLEVPGYPGFYFIPGYPTSGINLNGDLLYVPDGKIRKWVVSKFVVKGSRSGGYHTTNEKCLGKYKSIARHRALLLVFTDYPDNVDKLVTNHIDGVPGNDSLDNLEWVTRGQNNIHAYENDLKKQHIRVLIRNSITGVVTEYRSISYAASNIGISEESLRTRIYSSVFGKIFQDGTQVKLKTDTRDWVIHDDPEQAMLDARDSVSVLARCMATGTILRFEKIKDLAAKLQQKPGTVSARLQKYSLQPWMGYQFKYESDTTEFPSYTHDDYLNSFETSSMAKRVVGRNLLTGDTQEFDSVHQAVLWHNKPNLACTLREGHQPVLFTGWQLKQADAEWCDVDNLEEILYKSQPGAMARCEETGKVFLANNTKELARKLRLPSQRLRTSAYTRGNEVYRGYRFRLGISSEEWPTTKMLARSKTIRI